MTEPRHDLCDVDTALSRALNSGTPTIGKLHDRLAAAAARDGILDIAYRTLDTPVGRLLLAATDRGLLRVAFETEGHDGVLAQLAAKVSPRILNSPGRLDTAAREIEDYFGGIRHSFDLNLDWSLSRGFRAKVQRQLPFIPYGETQSYSEMAQAVGNPKAVRAVGSACATNPLPIVVPCHRVLRADGGIGGYAGGADTKAALLLLESGGGGAS